MNISSQNADQIRKVKQGLNNLFRDEINSIMAELQPRQGELEN
jgi:hypothetical protein